MGEAERFGVEHPDHEDFWSPAAAAVFPHRTRTNRPDLITHEGRESRSRTPEGSDSLLDHNGVVGEKP